MAIDAEKRRGLFIVVEAALRDRARPAADRLFDIARALTEALDVERAWICRVQGGFLHTLAGVAMAWAAPRFPPLSVERGVVGRVAREGKSACIDDVLTHPEYVPAVALTRSEVAVPVLHGGAVVGVINVEANRMAAFGPLEQQTVEEVAVRLAAAPGLLDGPPKAD